MKIYLTMLMAVFVLTGCTHVGVSNPSLLDTPQLQPEVAKDDRKSFPLHVDAEMSCSSSQSGNTIRTSCSNRSRLNKVTDAFNELGLEPYSSEDKFKGPEMSLKHNKMNSFLRSTTRFFNILTLGILPEYNYDKYTVSYNDSENNVQVSESVKVSSTRSWISLFIPNRKGLGESEMNKVAEMNLIRNVLDQAKVGQ